MRYNNLFQKRIEIHELIYASFEKKYVCVYVNCWFYIPPLLTKYFSRSTLFSPKFSQIAEIHLASWIIELRARSGEKKKKNSGKTPRVILYSYMWYYLRFDRAYARWEEFDGNRKWASDHVVSSLRANERNGSERLCSSPVTTSAFVWAFVQVCENFWLARTQLLIAHSGKAPFFSYSHLSGDTTWIASFEKHFRPCCWETSKTWQVLAESRVLSLSAKISGLQERFFYARTIHEITRPFKWVI